VLKNPDDTFFGLVDARQVAEILRSTKRAGYEAVATQFTEQKLADWINSSNTEGLKTLPGFVGWKDALDSKADREKALQQMNALGIQTIPVVNNGKFVGIIEQSKLTASILSEVATKINSQ